jgi:hypothetical protein
LARGSGVSSKLRITAAVSSVSLNWRIFAVLRDRRRLASAYTSARAGKHGGWNRSTLFGYQGCNRQPEISADVSPTPASPESAGMSEAALDRLENHLKQRYVDAGRFRERSS